MSQSSASRPFFSDSAPSAASRACANHGITWSPSVVAGEQRPQALDDQPRMQSFGGGSVGPAHEDATDEVGQAAVFDEHVLAVGAAVEQVDRRR